MKTRNSIFLGFLFILAAGLFTQGEAGIQRIFQMMRPVASQAVLQKDSFAAPAAAGTTQVLNAFAGNTSAAAVTTSTFVAQPDVPRNLVITPGGTTADVAACTIVVNGTNAKGAAISENFVFLNNASAATTGAKAFKTVSSIVFPLNCEDGGFAATWSVGYGSKLGLNWCMDNAGDVSWAEAAGVYEATRPTVTANATALESNTAAFNTAPDGSKNFLLFYVQNFRCL